MRMLLKIHTQIDKSQSTVGIGITATDYSGQLHAAWALRERMSGDSLQDQAEAVKLALMNAANQGWRNIEVELDNSKLKGYIVDSRHSSWRSATLIEDIQSISSLFHLCSFSLANTGKLDSIKLSLHAFKSWFDEEWVNPNLGC